MFVTFTPGPNIYKNRPCNFCDTYEDAVNLANWFYEKTGIVVTVEEVAQPPLCSA